jgi:hypothetical protein
MSLGSEGIGRKITPPPSVSGNGPAAGADKTPLMIDVRPQPSSGRKRWKRLNAVLHPGSTSVDHASFYMLSLCRTNLEIRLRGIDELSLSDSQKKTYAAVWEILRVPCKADTAARNLEWDEVYKAESLIAGLYSGAQLRQEVGARLHELADQSLSEADTLRRDYEALLKPPADGGKSEPSDDLLRGFLMRVLESIHWAAKKKYLARPIRKEATRRILIGLLFSFTLLVLPYLYLIWDFVAAPLASANSTNVSKVWSLFALWTALTAGLLGAFFSRLLSIQRQWGEMTLDEVFLHREWSYTLLRAGVGVCGALIMYFFLRSGIAEGALFPKFQEIMIEFIAVPGETAVPMTFVMPSKSLALLTFWCFLAGFSEALVPSILSSTERQLTEATATQGPRR